MFRSLPMKHNAFVLAAVLLCAAFAVGAQASPAAPTGEGMAKAGRSRFAKLDGMRLHYTDAGRGGDEALLFVHGWTCNAGFWRMQVPAFTDGRRVIAIDLPGHGQSDKPAEVAYTFDLFARAIDAVMRDAGVRRAVLVGHSLGTPIVRQFYRLYPQKTLALVFVDGGLRPFGPRERMEAFITPLRGEKYRETFAAMVDAMTAPQKSAELRAEVKAGMTATPQHVAVSAMEGALDEKYWKEDKIGVPVLTIIARSPFWKEDTESFFRRLAPEQDFQMWDGVSHFLMMDEPEKFNRALSDFLTSRKLLQTAKK